MALVAARADRRLGAPLSSALTAVRDRAAQLLARGLGELVEARARLLVGVAERRRRKHRGRRRRPPPPPPPPSDVARRAATAIVARTGPRCGSRGSRAACRGRRTRGISCAARRRAGADARRGAVVRSRLGGGARVRQLRGATAARRRGGPARWRPCRRRRAAAPRARARRASAARRELVARRPSARARTRRRSTPTDMRDPSVACPEVATSVQDGKAAAACRRRARQAIASAADERGGVRARLMRNRTRDDSAFGRMGVAYPVAPVERISKRRSSRDARAALARRASREASNGEAGQISSKSADLGDGRLAMTSNLAAATAQLRFFDDFRRPLLRGRRRATALKLRPRAAPARRCVLAAKRTKPSALGPCARSRLRRPNVVGRVARATAASYSLVRGWWRFARLLLRRPPPPTRRRRSPHHRTGR